MKLFYYTSSDRLQAIIDAGCIKGSEIQIEHADGSPLRGVWLSRNPVWEPACRAAVELEPLGARQAGVLDAAFVPDGAARLLVRAAGVRPWDEVLTQCGVDVLELLKFAQNGLCIGSDPDQWFIRLGDVPIGDVVNIEINVGAGWETCTAGQVC